jgi:hypothetical protein
MSTFEEFADAQHRLIEAKYDAIYKKRDEILRLRQGMTACSEPENDPNVLELKKLFDELNILEHELALLQYETYDVLEKNLKLNGLNVLAVFPHWKQEDHRPHVKSMVSCSHFGSPSDINPSSSMSTSVADYGHAPGYSFSKNYMTYKDTSHVDPNVHQHGHEIRSGIPSPLSDDPSKLLDEIRILRAKILKLKNKKNLNDKEAASKILFEEQLKAAENKYEHLINEQSKTSSIS